MNDKASSNESADNQAGSAAHNVTTKATNAIDSARSSAHGAVDHVADRANAAVGWTAARIGSAADTPNRYLDAGAGYIRERPYVAVGIALAVGYAVGRLKG